jgi:hypothetical protein
MKTLFLTAIIALFTVSSAHAGATFSVFGDVNMFTTKTSPLPAGGTDPSAKLGFGGGVGVEFGLSSMIGLSLEAIYEMHKMETSTAAFTSSVKTTSILFPVAARIWINPHFNLLGGGYYGMAMGKVKTETTVVSPAATVSTEQDYDAAGYKKGDYGLVAGLGINVPMSGAAFFVDARYYLGLANLNNTASSATTSVKTSNIQALIGVRFGGKK